MKNYETLEGNLEVLHSNGAVKTSEEDFAYMLTMDDVKSGEI